MPKPLFLRRPSGLYTRFLVPVDLRAQVGSRFLVRPLPLRGDAARLVAARLGLALSEAFDLLRSGRALDIYEALKARRSRATSGSWAVVLAAHVVAFLGVGFAPALPPPEQTGAILGARARGAPHSGRHCLQPNALHLYPLRLSVVSTRLAAAQCAVTASRSASSRGDLRHIDDCGRAQPALILTGALRPVFYQGIQYEI